MSNEIISLSATQIVANVASRALSARDVTEAFLARIDSVDGDVRAFITVTADKARQAADTIDAKIGGRGDGRPTCRCSRCLKRQSFYHRH